MSSIQQKKSILKLPGAPKPSKKYLRADQLLKLKDNEVKTTLSEKEIGIILGKKRENTIIDFSSSHFQFEDTSFMKNFPDTIKEYVS